MNQEWSNKVKEARILLKKENTYKQGIQAVLELRKSLFDMVFMVYGEFHEKGYGIQVFPNSKGYDSKTMAYSLYHILRIEDIVLHDLILGDEQIFYKGQFQDKMHASIPTTGNELVGKEIEDFSKALDIPALHEYFKAVYHSTNAYLEALDFKSLKNTVENNRNRVLETKSVSMDEEAIWLIDYWCGKDVYGLILMPFTRHWIMHIEAFLKIKNALVKAARKKEI